MTTPAPIVVPQPIVTVVPVLGGLPAAQPTLALDPLAQALSPVPNLAVKKAPPVPVTSRALLVDVARSIGVERRASGTGKLAVTLKTFFDGPASLAEPEPLRTEERRELRPNPLSRPVPKRPLALAPESVPTPVPAPAPTGIWAKTKAAASIAFGGVLLLLGAVMLVLPGPSTIFIILGLTILARHFIWAKTALRWVKRRVAKATHAIRHKLRAWKQKRQLSRSAPPLPQAG